MLKKALLLLALFGSTQKSQALENTSWSKLKTTCVIAGATGAVLISYKAYAHWLIKRAQVHFARERDLLNYYGNYSAHTQSWTTHDAAALLRDLKTSITHLHNTNRDRWDISVMYDIYYEQPAMYVSSNYHHFPLLQHVNDINWYLSHLKIIRFLHLHPHRQELAALIEQLEYIKHMLLSDHSYSQEEALYHAERRG